jgi:N-acyl-D-aspartate/D-glutamate deacylase
VVITDDERPYEVGILRDTLLDPAQQLYGQYDIAVAGGRVATVEPATNPGLCRSVVDAAGQLVVPGLIGICQGG